MLISVTIPPSIPNGLGYQRSARCSRPGGGNLPHAALGHLTQPYGCYKVATIQLLPVGG